ncbi:hypothetical protein N1851_032003 [Merluccius polli]|uniref:Uncharacterized protein n=1 Tax=Merluccius polli TaxID=89951 RepID=A0AA47M3E4_MERPO|nr:hypothetical protein N1851_032003 [Merluccius polli]
MVMQEKVDIQPEPWESLYEGTSLNDHLLTLCRFPYTSHCSHVRCGKNVSTGFHVSKEDRGYCDFSGGKMGDTNSEPSEHRMVHLFGSIVFPWLRKGGLHLHKFLSNNREVLDSINNAERRCRGEKCRSHHEELPVQRVLGVTLDEKPATRRGILSIVASLYDPLGFLAPFILEGKRVLQEMCPERYGGGTNHCPGSWK